MRSKRLHHKPCFYNGFYNPQKAKLSLDHTLSRVIIGLNLTYSCEISGVTKTVIFASFPISHNNQSYIITRIQTQKHVPLPCTAFIAEEAYYHNSLVYSGSSTYYKVRLTNYKNTILVVSFMQIGLSINIYSYTQCHTGIFESRMHLALFSSILFSHYPYLYTRDNGLRTMDTILMYQ